MAEHETDEVRHPDGPDYERDESRAEQLDRNWNELLQELRVMQTGAQIIAAFLIMLPFQARFADLDAFQTDWYLGLLVASLTVVAVIVAPVSLHRILFHRRAKDAIVATTSRLLRIALILLIIVLAGIAVLIFDVVVGPVAAIIAGSAALAVGLLLIEVLPRLLLRRD